MEAVQHLSTSDWRHALKQGGPELRGELTRLLWRPGARSRTTDLTSLVEGAALLRGAELREFCTALSGPARKEAARLPGKGAGVPAVHDLTRIWPEWSRRRRPALARLAQLVMADGGTPEAGNALTLREEVTATRLDPDPGVLAPRLAELQAQFATAQSV